MSIDKSKLSVTQLYFYPIKSCAGTSLRKASIGRRGIEHDRLWMVVDEKGEFLTQRQLPKMALIKPEYDSSAGLLLTAYGMPKLSLDPHVGGDCKEVLIWGDVCAGVDQGNEVADWLSGFLARKCRLVKMADNFERQVDQKYARSARDVVGFADGHPFLLISEESLEDLNQRLACRVAMDRFRPSIVVAGCEPYAEDDWQVVRIGEVQFDVVKPCARCVITTVDQQTAEVKAEPLETLSAYRIKDKGIMFGQNLIHHSSGEIAVGNRVELLA